MKLKLLALRSLASALTSYRKGPPRPELDRRLLPHQRIALVKLDGIGDFILATGLLRLFQSDLPEARVTLFCRQAVGQLARQQFPAWTVVEIPTRQTVLRELLLDGTVRRLLRSQPVFDLLLDLRAFREFGEATLASWIPARHKLALVNAHSNGLRWVPLPMEHRVYDHLLPLPDYTRQNAVHDLQNFDLLADYFFPGRRHLPPNLKVATEAQRLLVKRWPAELSAPFLLVCPSAGSRIREYPPVELARAVASVVNETPLTVVIAGGKQDLKITGQVAQALGQAGVKFLNLTGVLNLAEHVVLTSLAQAILCMETGNAHIACALGRPGVAIIGGGHYGLFAPWGESPIFRWLAHPLPCFGCFWNCIHDRPLCIQDIPAERIAKTLREILAPSGRYFEGLSTPS